MKGQGFTPKASPLTTESLRVFRNGTPLKSAMNKVKELCGEVHDVQAKVVAGCLAQTVNAALRGVWAR